MTAAQRRIVRTWWGGAFFVLGILLFEDWLLEHWEMLKWPVFFVILMFAVFSKNDGSPHDRREAILGTIEDNPWIKVYLAAYLLILAAVISYVLSKNIAIFDFVGPFELLIAILLLVLPVIAIRQKEAYVSAGEKPNK